MAIIKKLVSIDVEMCPFDLAKLFCEMDAGQQALFFSHVDALVDEWDTAFCFQMQGVTDDGALTDGGRKIMRVIGEYSEKQEA